MFYKLHQNIYFIDKMNEKMNRYFNWLFRAICLVDANYLKYKVDNYDSDANHEFHKERVFAYELYRQWANILEAESKEPLVLNAELDKIIAEDIEDTYEGSEQGDNRYTNRRYPDLVLHNGQGNDKDQKIICEIKRQDNTTISSSLIFADLYKLACYLDEDKFTKKPFEYGVFILLNGSLDKIKDIKNAKIKISSKKYKYQQFKDEMGKHFEEIICVTYDGINLEYRTLKGLL